MSTLAALVAALGGLVTAIGSAIVAYTKQRADVQAAKGSRIDLMEARIDKVQAQFEAEHDKRIKAETLAHRLRLGLITTMDYGSVGLIAVHRLRLLQPLISERLSTCSKVK
ncbi:hypothetical protein ABMV07_01035 [Corynebacterium belfantii]|uniref:hypothetical protein n=1 Tax=Corynebacterium belfantii TaxID=2014537 RepID=UPI0035A91D48